MEITCCGVDRLTLASAVGNSVVRLACQSLETCAREFSIELTSASLFELLRANNQGEGGRVGWCRSAGWTRA